MPRCSFSGSVSWSPTVITGFSAVIGSWKIIPMSRPRRSRICGLLSSSRSRPSNIRPSAVTVALDGSSPITASELTDLPEPDSPTIARISPRLTS